MAAPPPGSPGKEAGHEDFVEAGEGPTAHNLMEVCERFEFGEMVRVPSVLAAVVEYYGDAFTYETTDYVETGNVIWKVWADQKDGAKAL